MRNVDKNRKLGLTEPGTYPFTLIIGRRFTLHQGNHRLRNDTATNQDQLVEEAAGSLDHMEMNPEDVLTLGLSDGAKVQVSSETGSLNVVVRRSSRLAQGNLFLQVPDSSPVFGILLSRETDDPTLAPKPLPDRAFLYTAVRVDLVDE